MLVLQENKMYGSSDLHLCPREHRFHTQSLLSMDYLYHYKYGKVQWGIAD